MNTKRLEAMVLLLVLVATLNTEVMAQAKQGYKRIEMKRVSAPITVTADSLWRIIRQFDDVAVWSSAMDKITLHGTPEFEGATCNSRTCESAQGFGKVKEKMTEFNDQKRELAYESTEGGPNFLLYGKNHWTVIELSPTQSALKLNFELHLKSFPAFFIGGTIKRTIAKGLPVFFNDLATYAETGKVSVAKQKRMAKYENRYRTIERTLTSEVIRVSADSLWAICREFDKTAEWTSTLKHSYGTGEPIHEGASCSARTCEPAFGKGNKVVEELTLFSDRKKELAYDLVEGAPGFIVRASNHWKVTEVSAGESRIEMKVTLRMKKWGAMVWGGLVVRQMKKQVGIVQRELKVFAETGVVQSGTQSRR